LAGDDRSGQESRMSNEVLKHYLKSGGIVLTPQGIRQGGEVPHHDVEFVNWANVFSRMMMCERLTMISLLAAPCPLSLGCRFNMPTLDRPA
jgi:hypothetical protein